MERKILEASVRLFSAYGLRKTSMEQVAHEARADARDHLESINQKTHSFMGRIGRTEDMAGLAIYLASPAATFVTGTVIHGEKRGRGLGFPTANIRLDKNCELKHGIYAVRVGRGSERLDGVASFGRRPTFDNGAPLLEVFLFDFKGDLYGAELDVAFIAFIREELKFDSVDALVERMNEDSARARADLAAAPEAFPRLGSIG